MKRLARLLCLLLCFLLLPALAEEVNMHDPSVTGPWEEENVATPGNPWRMNLGVDGKGTLYNNTQSIEVDWELFMQEGLVKLELWQMDGKDIVTHLNEFDISDATLWGEDGRVYVRPEPDTVVLEEYKPAKPASKSSFDGVWDATGIVVTMDGFTIPFTAEEIAEGFGVSLPFRIAFKSGRVIGNKMEDNDPLVAASYQSFFTGDSIYVTKIGLPYALHFFLVHTDTLHARLVGLPVDKAEGIMTMVRVSPGSE